MADFPATFQVLSERNCPFYRAGDRFVLNRMSLKVPDSLPSCLILVREFTGILTDLMKSENPDEQVREEDVFNCGGCVGLIKFKLDNKAGSLDEEQILQVQGQYGQGMDVQPSNANGSVVVSGTLKEISPSDLLQFFHMHQKTGRLSLDLPKGKGRIAFREGEVIGALYGKEKGKDAIYSILAAGDGKFGFEAGLPDSLMDVEDIGDFMILLMEGLRRIDESLA